jgi:hypothetical protein
MEAKELKERVMKWISGTTELSKSLIQNLEKESLEKEEENEEEEKEETE